LASLDPAAARATVVVAPHDAALLADTVAANVAAAADDAPGPTLAGAAGTSRYSGSVGAGSTADDRSGPTGGDAPGRQRAETDDAATPAVRRAIAAAAVDDVVEALPDGLHTRLTDSGRSLSGGQRQRIALARALAAPAPVLVLHEPTTALDAATEGRIAGALRAARGGRTAPAVT